MMAGASVGGIIATGLAHRVCAKAIYVMLTRDGGAIFAKTLLTNVLNALEPKYDAARSKLSSPGPSAALCLTASPSPN